MLLLWVLLPLAFAVEFQTLEGLSADPCNKYLVSDDTQTGLMQDCPINSERSAFSNVIMIERTTIRSIGVGRVFTVFGVGFKIGTTGSMGISSTDNCATGTILNRVNAQVTRRTDGLGDGLQITFSLFTGDTGYPTPLADRPLPLCWTASSTSVVPVWRYTGFKVATSLINCDVTITAGASVQTTCTAAGLANALSGWSTTIPHLNTLQRQVLFQRTSCCKPSATNRGANSLLIGDCYHPSVQGCCGGVIYELSQEKCCNEARGWTVPLDGHCPCLRGTRNADCPPGESCCLREKYALMTNTAAQQGQCFNPAKESCCDTGSIYDPGTSQCCVINGVQSINVPCPCSDDSHCIGGQNIEASNLPSIKLANRVCCQQWQPPPREASTATNTLAATVALCNINTNYPTGQGAPQIQRCPGFCIDADYAICCNGVQCMKAYERCCNSTCCNKWSSSCLRAYRPVSDGIVHNPNAYRDIYSICSTVEGMTVIKAFWIFVVPAVLGLIMSLVLAMVTVFATKATPRSFSKLEYAMVFFAVVTSGLMITHFFSITWKYALWTISVQMIVILAAAARVKWLNVAIIIANFITLVYVYDPFSGNAWLTLSVDTAAGPLTSGLLHTVELAWRHPEICTGVWEWFQYDPQLRDTLRFDNPAITTFGYCSRGWGTALLFFGGISMICILIQLILDLFGLYFRFRREEIELEVHEEPQHAFVY